MASVFKKRGRFWARLMGAHRPGKWGDVDTHETDRELAMEFARAAQAELDAKWSRLALEGSFAGWVERWLVRRKQAVHDWKKEVGRLNNHVLPTLGHLPITDITTKHIADLVHELRFEKHLANRTVRSIYSVIAAVMRDAAIEGLIKTTPCTLTEAQLGSVIDKDPEWRAGALFTRAEAEIMISDRHIPLDRRVTYAFGLLAGMRPGEAAALRWRHYEPTCEPLGKLTIALAYSTPNHKLKGTKTEAVRVIPVHPVLALLLAEWRTGWIVMFGRPPEPDDLIIPLPPETAARRTSRLGEAFRYSDYTLRRWTDVDEPRLGWVESTGRHRSVYDTKSTFITLAIDDGADRDILRDRVTHSKPRRDAFDLYDRGPHWVETCTEVSKLRIRYLAATVQPEISTDATQRDDDGSAESSGSGGGFRMLGNARVCAQVIADDHVSAEHLRTGCDRGLEIMAAGCADTCSQLVEP